MLCLASVVVNEWPTQTEVMSITGRQLALHNVLLDPVDREVNEHSAKPCCKNMLKRYLLPSFPEERARV